MLIQFKFLQLIKFICLSIKLHPLCSLWHFVAPVHAIGKLCSAWAWAQARECALTALWRAFVFKNWLQRKPKSGLWISLIRNENGPARGSQCAVDVVAAAAGAAAGAATASAAAAADAVLVVHVILIVNDDSCAAASTAAPIRRLFGALAYTYTHTHTHDRTHTCTLAQMGAYCECGNDDWECVLGCVVPLLYETVGKRFVVCFPHVGRMAGLWCDPMDCWNVLLLVVVTVVGAAVVVVAVVGGGGAGCCYWLSLLLLLLLWLSLVWGALTRAIMSHAWLMMMTATTTTTSTTTATTTNKL